MTTSLMRNHRFAAALVIVTALAGQTGDSKAKLPLKPERKLAFTTDEGTWLSIDVSPDGKLLVFDLLGDLYTLPIAGGEAKRITSGLAFDSQPRFAPDGRSIAYVSDADGSENLWVARTDGSEPQQLSRDSDSGFVSPSWTPDGESILVSRNAAGVGVHEIWMYGLRGGSGVQVTRSPAGSDERPNFLGAIVSRDGKTLYFARRNGSFSFNAKLPLWQIVQHDRTTGEEEVITNSFGSAFSPALSPDGALLVYGTRFDGDTGLRIRELSSGNERWLKYPVQRDEQEARPTRDLIPGYAFTPDGKEIVLCYGGKIRRVQIATGEATGVPFTAQVSVDLGPALEFRSRVEQGSVRARIIQSPQESPDGRRLVFSAFAHLYVLDLPDGKPRRITSGDTREFQPSWSPDGQYIAYVSWSDSGGYIWKLRMDGKSLPVQVSDGAAYYQDPVWTPDGSRIVGLRASTRARLESVGGGTALQVVWVANDGGKVVSLPVRGVGRPHFGIEPDRMYVHSAQGLLSFRFDGSDRRTHLKVVGKNVGGATQPAPAQDIRVAADGRYALALVNKQLYLFQVPVVGGEPPTINVAAPSVPMKKITDVGADDFAWADGGRTITWSLGSSFFRQPRSTVFSDAGPGSPRPRDEKNVVAPNPGPQYEEIAVDVEVPRHTPRGTIVLRGATVITMRQDEVIPDADIIVEDNRIAAIGRRGEHAIPAGARVVNLKGKFLMPGIVDVHAHWTEIRRGVLDLNNNWPFLANLAYGVTTGRDPQSSTNDVFVYQDLVEAGEMLGPRAFSTGPGIFSNTDISSLEEARRVVGRYKKYYGVNTVKSYVIGNRKQRQWMVMACKEHELMVTTEGAMDLKLDLTHAIDGFSGNEHALPTTPLQRDVVELFAQSRIFYTPTLVLSYGGPLGENYFYETTEVHDDAKLRRFVPHNVIDSRTQRRDWFRPQEYVLQRLAESAARIVRKGGRVCVGGHGQMQGIQCHWEMWALASGGMSNHEVLRAATLSGAEALGYSQDLGSIEPGKLADLIVLDRNPLDNIRNTSAIRYVMKNGELFEGETLLRVWPVQTPLHPLWWWNDDPHTQPSLASVASNPRVH